MIDAYETTTKSSRTVECCVRDLHTDNNLIDYYAIIFTFVTYYLLDRHFSFYSLPSNDLQLSWGPGLSPAKSGPGF